LTVERDGKSASSVSSVSGSLMAEYVVVLDGGRPWGVRLQTDTLPLPTSNNLSQSGQSEQQQQQQRVTVAKVKDFFFIIFIVINSSSLSRLLST